MNVMISLTTMITVMMMLVIRIQMSAAIADPDMIDARTAINYVNEVRQGPCKGGTANTLRLSFDHAHWNRYASIAIKTANLLTKLIIQGRGKLSSVDEYFLYGLCRNNIQGDTLVFGSAIAFEAGVFGNYSLFCPYAHMADVNVANAFDLSLYYDYSEENVEWYATLRNRDWRNQTTTTDNVTYGFEALYQYSQPQAHLHNGHWTYPYFDCGGGDIWMVTYSSPIFSFHFPTNEPVFRGIATIDIELTNIDIDQCDIRSTASERDDSGIDVFHGTHNCQPTTKCHPISGLGFRRGTYECICEDGFYFPNLLSTRKAFNGSDIEGYFDTYKDSRHRAIHSFRCLRCSRGCDTCDDASPCMFVYSQTIRIIITVIATLIVVGIVYLFYIIHHYRDKRVMKSASPIFLYIMCLGGILITLQIFVMYAEPTDAMCIAKYWLSHVGFSLLYGALLIKTYRISAIFQKTGKRIHLPDKVLLRYSIPILVLVIGFLVAWMAVSHPRAVRIKANNGLKYVYCDGDWWEYAAAGAEALFLLWGVYLSFTVRKAPSQFNESKFITWSIYNGVLMGTFIIIITEFIAVPMGPDISFLMLFLDLQIRVTITLLLIFIPKIYTLRMLPYETSEGQYTCDNAVTTITGRAVMHQAVNHALSSSKPLSHAHTQTDVLDIDACFSSKDMTSSTLGIQQTLTDPHNEITHRQSSMDQIKNRRYSAPSQRNIFSISKNKVCPS